MKTFFFVFFFPPSTRLEIIFLLLLRRFVESWQRCARIDSDHEEDVSSKASVGLTLDWNLFVVATFWLLSTAKSEKEGKIDF